MPVKLNAAQAKAMGVIPPRKPRNRSGKGKATKALPSLFIAACVAHGLPEPVPECRFYLDREWRFDWSWPSFRGIGGVALEIEGGVWTRGRHLRGSGFLGDMEKYNQAVILGWKVLRCTPQDVKSGKVFELLREVLL